MRNVIFVIFIFLNFHIFYASENCSICFDETPLTQKLLTLETHKDTAPKLCTNCFSRLQACPFCKCGMNRNDTIVTCDGIGKSQVVDNEGDYFDNIHEELEHAGAFAEGSDFFVENYNSLSRLNNRLTGQTFYEMISTLTTVFIETQNRRAHRRAQFDQIGEAAVSILIGFLWYNNKIKFEGILRPLFQKSITIVQNLFS